MTWEDFVDQCVAKLTDCRDKAEFEQALAGVNKQLDSWSIDRTRREWFWRELDARYQKAPKLILKEATASAKLNQLTLAADALLAAAAKGE